MEVSLKVTVDFSESAKELIKKLIERSTILITQSRSEGEKATTLAKEPPIPTGAREESEKPEASHAPEPDREKPQETREAEVESGEVTYPDDEEMRQQMDIVISKFAGNGWKESKDSRTLAIKKGCTSVFKEIAKWLGAEKPTALEGAKRLEFVKRLEEVFIEDKGEGKVPEIAFRPY